MSWEQESGDDLPLIYHHLAANRRILEAHEAEQDRLEAEACAISPETMELARRAVSSPRPVFDLGAVVACILAGPGGT